MSESDPTVPPVAPSETGRYVPFFEGTSIPQLTLEHDSEWLDITLPYNRGSDPVIIAQLNNDANGAEGRLVARDQAFKETYLSRPNTHIPIEVAEAATRARRRFYKAILGRATPPEAANAMELAAGREMKPSRFIGVTRMLHEFVGEHLDEVLVTGRYLYTAPSEKLAERLNILVVAGVDVRAVLLASPITIIAKYSGDDASFIRLGQQAERRYRKNLAAAERSGAIAVPKVTNPAERVGANLQRPQRYDELARVSGISLVMLQAAFPNVDSMAPNAYAKAMEKVGWLADEITDRDLRVRDLTEFIKPPKEREP